MVRVEQLSLLKNDGPPRVFQLAHPPTHSDQRLVGLRKRIPGADYDGRSSNGSYQAQTGLGGGGLDRQWSAAMRCAAGERALFTAETQIAGRRASSSREAKKRRMMAGRCRWGEGDYIYIRRSRLQASPKLASTHHSGANVATPFSTPAPPASGPCGDWSRRGLDGQVLLAQMEWAGVR